LNVAYVDTSVMVALAFAEPHAERMKACLRECDYILSSNLLEAEFRSALLREGIEERADFLAAIGWVIPDRPLSEEFRRVSLAGFLRGADLWHLACALYLSPEPGEMAFLTLDSRQADVASSLGFRSDFQ